MHLHNYRFVFKYLCFNMLLTWLDKKLLKKIYSDTILTFVACLFLCVNILRYRFFRIFSIHFMYHILIFRSITFRCNSLKLIRFEWRKPRNTSYSKRYTNIISMHLNIYRNFLPYARERTREGAIFCLGRTATLRSICCIPN